MRDPRNDSEIARRFAAHSETAFARAPLNAALAATISRDRTLFNLLQRAPAEQQLPVLLLAAVHSMVLRSPGHRLGDWYPNLRIDPLPASHPDLSATLTQFIRDHEHAILDLVTRRSVQTNEIGRCALFLPALATIGDETGDLAHLDVGTSAGLNTLLPRFTYRYNDGATVGSNGPVLLCSTRGDGPTPTALPSLTASRGLDPSPLDVTDDDDANWLQACCWPDQADRFQRLSAAIDMARHDPPDVRVGNAVDDVRHHVLDLAAAGHPVVTTSWVLNYLTPPDRSAFIEQLDRAGEHVDLSWVFAESPALTPELPHKRSVAAEHTTALVIVRWRGGRRSVEHLGICHPHGYWLHWH